MKIVSVVFFFVALVGSWIMTRTASPIPEAMHVGIQNDLKNIIADYVQKNLPQSKNLRFEKFWTEAVKRSKVKAFFTYTFDDTTQENGATAIQIEGWALLNKIDEGPETVTWSLDELQVQDNRVDFKDPIHITSGAGGIKPEIPPAPATPPPTETH